MKQPRRVQAALEKDAALRLARFERLEQWQGLSPGDQVRVAGHRGGTWRFRAFVTNTSNGASWVEVSETLAAGRRRTRGARSFDPQASGLVRIGPAGAGPGREPDDSETPGAATEATTVMSRTRSFRPELVTPLRRSRRRKRAADRPEAAPVQESLFDQA